MNVADYEHLSHADKLEPLVRDMMQKYGDTPLALEDVEAIVGPDYTQEEIRGEILSGVRRGEYLVDPSHFPHKYTYNADRTISGEAAEIEEEQETAAAAPGGPVGKTDRRQPRKMGFMGRLRSVLNDEGPQTMQQLVARFEKEGWKRKQIENNTYNAAARGAIEVVAGSDPREFTAKGQKNAVPYQPSTKRNKGLIRDAFRYLAESGDHLTADELAPHLKFKWSVETISAGLSTAYFNNALSREPGIPHRYYVEYNKRVAYLKALTLPTVVTTIDPDEEEDILPPSDVQVQETQHLLADQLGIEGTPEPGSLAAMALEGLRMQEEAEQALTAGSRMENMPPDYPLEPEPQIIAPVLKVAETAEMELPLPIFNPMLDVLGRLHFQVEGGAKFMVDETTTQKLAWLLKCHQQ